ncbi:reticulophagy regulator 3 [Anguilla anguilla]|uniref:reticulophagy regulator 3 n=1 Tax=Anguilla anguilla TaxID=7936 RepID=UPI0015AD3066|nr:reticulophagy regulator 3 [Anguilla anguilla]
MALMGGTEDTTKRLGSQTMESGANIGLCKDSRPCSRTGQVRVAEAEILEILEPYEPAITYLQSVLVWERPLHSVLHYTFINVVFWFFALCSLRLLFLLSAGLGIAVCLDTWGNRIWHKIGLMQSGGKESWGLVHPGVLSVPELSHHMAEVWVTLSSFTQSLVQLRQYNPAKFCLLVCGFFSFVAMLGYYVPGLVFSYTVLLAVLLCPLAANHRVFHGMLVHLEPALQRLDFSASGYMMSQPKENQFLRRPIRHAYAADDTDSEEELSAFCPELDDAVVAKELEITDSEHSDAEVSYTENGTFNLSRGQTPLTEGSEDFDRRSDAEESFSSDLPDFPSINPEATLMDDDDDTSIGLPSLGPSRGHGPGAASLDVEAQMDLDQDSIDDELSLSGLPPASDFTAELSGIIASNMIQAALAGALQPRPPSGSRRAGRDGSARQGYRKQSSSELDTDPEGEDFEMLDQSELNQMDPAGASGQGGRQGGPQQHRNQGPSFLSNLLGKPQ